MPIVPLYGHDALRARVLEMVARGTLPASLLLHGSSGVGKQRAAIWVAQVLLCERDERPCGNCVSCKSVGELRHPDVYWFYPRARLKAPDPTVADVLEDYAEGTAERVARHGLYAPPSGTDGIYIATVRAVVQRAGLAPAVARRKVFIVGDAERMISQEGADQAANAFLKLLEEPPADTTIVLTSSEPGALLPTIRSRVVAFRCAALAEHDVRAFLENDAVRVMLDELDVPGRIEDRIALAAGAPGSLLAREALSAATAGAREILEAAERYGTARYATALSQGVSSARGAFTDVLETINVLLRERVQQALARGDADAAFGASRGIEAVARAQTRAEGNVNPQLVTARLVRELGEVLV